MIAVQMMPPACPVEPHVGGYHRHDEEFRDATGLPGGASRWQLTQPMPENLKMPPACPVEIRACGYHRHDEEFRDATGLPGGASRWQLTQPMPEM